jgi:hypothetical protein
MDLHLTFVKGRIEGDGNDDVGVFLIRGQFEAANHECYWTKTYPGSHEVYYRGFREGKGIWGKWEINLLAHGGFHIWPKSLSEGETAVESNEAGRTTEAVGQWIKSGEVFLTKDRPEPELPDVDCYFSSRFLANCVTKY